MEHNILSAPPVFYLITALLQFLIKMLFSQAKGNTHTMTDSPQCNKTVFEHPFLTLKNVFPLMSGYLGSWRSNKSSEKRGWVGMWLNAVTHIWRHRNDDFWSCTCTLVHITIIKTTVCICTHTHSLTHTQLDDNKCHCKQRAHCKQVTPSKDCTQAFSWRFSYSRFSLNS